MYTIDTLLQTKLKKAEKQTIEFLQFLKGQEVVMKKDFNKACTAVWKQFPYISAYRFGNNYNDDNHDYKLYESMIGSAELEAVSPYNITADSYSLFLKAQAKWQAFVAQVQKEENKKRATAFLKAIEKAVPQVEILSEIAERVKSATDARKEAELKEIKGKTHPEVQAAVDMIAEDFRVTIENNWYNYFIRIIVDFKKKADEMGTTNIFKLYEDDRTTKKDYGRLRSALLEVLNVTPVKERGVAMGSTYKAKTNEQIREIATEHSIREIGGFKYKMTFKLGGLFGDVKVKVSAEKIYGGPSNNEIIFRVNDGESQFVIRNTIVNAVSCNWTPFHRFPTTFHDATIKGKKLKFPDEYNVKSSLNAAYKNI